ncbi:hypothetical protein XENOCAPTIV_012651 [Xenoophorus captivus]|uniref:Squamous cell carcinoma antigen recognized by T-cells 3 n=1 Tax=Xenoophorus captivus TaxID=1517983 RepID=A0ABV0R3M0_9TELE
MAAPSDEEQTQLQDMEEEEAGMEEREMESDEEEGMGVENSEDEEDDSSEDDKENEAEIQRLEEQLSINAFDYNCHVDLIKLLKQEGELCRLRKARQKMSELFPLTEGPDIWLEYAQYSIGGMGSPGGIDKVRSIFERAVTAVGLHMTKGQTLWEAYREFENAVLSTVQPPSGRIPSREEQELLSAQLQRIHTLFRRQLAVPLMGKHGDSSVQMDCCKLEAIPEGDPPRIQIMFERALAENCLVPDMWTKYATYLDRQLKIKDLVLSTHERAVRNCPWTMSLWKSYLQALERHGADHQSVSEQFSAPQTTQNTFVKSCSPLRG